MKHNGNYIENKGMSQEKRGYFESYNLYLSTHTHTQNEYQQYGEFD